MKADSNLNHMQHFWEAQHSTDTYFDCRSNYEEDIKSKYGKFKHLICKEALISMGLKNGSWGKSHNSNVCFKDIEKDGFDWTILEMGCGYGGFGVMLAAFVKQYDGIDISTHIVNKGNETISKCGIKNMCLTNVPESDLSQFPDNRYDMIFSTAVFIHIDRSVTEHYLRETRRLLKSTGIFIHHMNVTTEYPVDIIYNKIYMVDDCKKMFNRVGLDVLYQHDGIDFQSSPTAFMRYFCGMPKGV
jgi:ubiquinone/menaquinone biosynthesis C-methylase UbiE